MRKARNLRLIIILLCTIMILCISGIITYRIMNSRNFQFFGGLVTRVDTNDKAVALTFDDGPSEKADEILSILEAQNVRATFFLVGSDIEQHPEETQKIIAAGHEIGNHTYSHGKMIFRSSKYIENEIGKTDNLIKELGYEDPIQFRPPYGKKLVLLPYYLYRHDRKTIMWDIEPNSYPDINSSVERIVEYVVNNAKPGSIILLHPWNEKNNNSIEAIQGIIEGLRNKGYEFKTVNELLGIQGKMSPEITPSENLTPSAGPENNEIQISPEPTDRVESDSSGNEGITTPVLVNGVYMGGLYHGKWMQQDEFFRQADVSLEGFPYDIFIDGSNTGRSTGSLPTSWMSGLTLEGDQYDQEYCIVDLLDEDGQNIDYDIAIKADWNLFPRPYKIQNPDQTYYLDLIKNYLMEYGLENPETTIKQMIKVDLEGDGTDEVLIAADNTKDDQFIEVKKGDNAILLFRKMVDGEVINQPVEQDIRVEEEEYPTIFRYLSRVETIADLDGDNTLEVIVKSWYYEGVYWSIYKLIDDRLELVASGGYGA